LKEDKKKYNQLYSEYNDIQQKYDKQVRILTKKENELDVLNDDLHQKDQDCDLLQLQHDKLELMKIQKEREVVTMKKEMQSAYKELIIIKDENVKGKKKMEEVEKEIKSREDTIGELQDDSIKSQLKIMSMKDTAGNMKRELVEMAQSIVTLPPGVINNERIIEVITDMAPRIIPTFDEINKMECNFENLIPLLDLIFETFRVIDNSDLLVSVGNSGCGASTMMNALMYGPDALEEKQLEFMVKGPKGQMTKRLCSVIDQREEFMSKKVFKVGHSEHESTTVIPSFVKDEVNNFIYADIAGVSDMNGGEFIEFINIFIDRYIFLKANQVRFLVPITMNQNDDSTGLSARQ